MATEEHKRLADIVKKTHAVLRAECRLYGAKITWERHKARNDILQEYARSLQKLATMYWAKNGMSCRMEWIRAQCKEYFHNGGEEKYQKMERDIHFKITSKISKVPTFRDICHWEMIPNAVEYQYRSVHIHHIQRISILDVGSCYNPLSIDDALDVTAIDLIPAKGVFRCDFLNVAIGREKILSQDAQEIHQLPVNSFDAVVFSLLLEYLPCPKQRYICCKNAYDVLKFGGLLIIVSPDSKHVGANARLMKSWRYTLSKLGFMRIKYEKLRHMHCLVFKKCMCKKVAARWCELQHFSEDDKRYMSETEIFIPQDFQTICAVREQEKLNKYDETDLASTFSELPFHN